MSEELPEGWSAASALEIGDLIRGVSYEKGEAASVPGDGRIALLRANNIGNGINFDDLQYVPAERVAPVQMLRQGDVVIAMSSGSKAVVGKAATLHQPWTGTFGAFCGAIRPVDGIVPRFHGLFYQTLAYRQMISELASGTNINNLRREHFAGLKVGIPPMAEQVRIAAKAEMLLSETKATQERLARVPVILKRFRQAVLAAACSGQLTESWRKTRNDTPITPSPTSAGLELDNLPDLPDTWIYRRADAVVEQGTIITYGIVLPGPETPSGVPYVRQQDIEDGKIHIPQLRRTAPEIAAKHERSSIRAGDVLLCIIRNLRVAIVPEGIDGANLTQGTVRMRPSADILAEYLAAYLESVHAQTWMKQRYIGMSMPRINVEHARAIPIALPPIEEQKEIVRRISALFAVADELEQKLAAATARVEKLPQTILQKAFRGELVPTEAELARREGRDYEPASVLLERIRKERGQEAAPTRGRKRQSTRGKAGGTEARDE